MDNRFLFRGKQVDNGEWVYGNLIVWGSRAFIHYEALNSKNKWREVMPETVGQCTGLTAAKSYRGEGETDLLVFEGDVFSLGEGNIKYMVVWEDTGLIGKQLGSNSYVGLKHWRDRIEIISNRWEHPELLELLGLEGEDD